jgi:WD40 repeat protein
VTGHALCSVAWSEGLVATAGADDVIRLWDITPAGQNQCIRQLEGHTYPVFGLSWRSDGHRLASASEDYTARIWDPVRPAHAAAGCHTLGGLFPPHALSHLLVLDARPLQP